MNGTPIAVACALAGMLALMSGNVATAAGPADAPPGALSCSGCHPAGRWVDTSVPRLVGRDAPAVIAAMLAFRSGAKPATVMDRIAKGFTDDEIKAIATWYAAQHD